MFSTIDSMSPSMTAPSSGIKIHTKKWYQQMALILLCEEVIEPTASAVMCVKNDRICDIIFQLYPSAWCQIIHLTKIRTESENSRLIPFSATKKLPWRKWLPRPQKWMEKNSDKSHGSTGMFPHRFGRFLPQVGHLPSEKSILLDFSSSRVVAISVPFPEVQNRKGAESGLGGVGSNAWKVNLGQWLKIEFVEHKALIMTESLMRKRRRDKSYQWVA